MKTSFKVKSVVFVLAVIISLVGVWQLKNHLTQWCQEIGKTTGAFVGNAMGSYDGYVEGKEDGKRDGEKAGLSAEDTQVSLQQAVTAAGKLEVLAAGVSLKNLNEIGDTYKSLYMASGEAIFTVNLINAEVSFNEDHSDIHIAIPRPTLQVYLDQNSTQKLAETQKFSFTVGSEDGITAYLNSMSQSMDKVSETIANYDALVELAEEASVNQVRQLASALLPAGSNVTVEFKK